MSANADNISVERKGRHPSKPQVGAPRRRHHPNKQKETRKSDEASKITLGRERLGWTQEQLAEKAGVDVKTIQNVENGRTAKPKTIRLLCDLLEAALESGKEHKILAGLLNANEQTSQSNPHQTALLGADSIFENESCHFVVGHIADERELHTAWELDCASYGDACWPFEILKQRWEAFPQGCQSVMLNGKSVGSFGLWPLTDAFTTLLKKGDAGEDDITPRMLIDAQETTVKSWYFSGVEIQPQLRSADALKQLLSQGLRNVLRAADTGYPCSVLAFAFSDNGERLLKRFGFSCILLANTRKNSWPMYHRKFDSEQHFEEVLRARRL